MPLPYGWPADARAAFARADWPTARDLYEQALAAARDEPEALDGLGQSLWWLGETQASIELRDKAFAAYQRRGDRERAGFVGTYLAAEYRIAGNVSLAQGWLGRAQRLLDGLDECTALGWLEIELSKRTAEPVEEERHAQRALELARRIGDPDIEAAALSHVGLARVSQGRWRKGWPCSKRRWRWPQAARRRTRWRSVRPAASRSSPASNSPTFAGHATSAAPSPTSRTGATTCRWRPGAVPSTSIS